MSVLASTALVVLCVVAAATVLFLFIEARLWEPPIWSEPPLTRWEFDRWFELHPGQYPPIRPNSVKAYRRELYESRS